MIFWCFQNAGQITLYSEFHVTVNLNVSIAKYRNTSCRNFWWKRWVQFLSFHAYQLVSWIVVLVSGYYIASLCRSPFVLIIVSTFSFHQLSLDVHPLLSDTPMISFVAFLILRVWISSGYFFDITIQTASYPYF